MTHARRERSSATRGKAPLCVLAEPTRRRPEAPVPQTREARRGNTRRRRLLFNAHGAQTRLGLRGGGRLRVLSTDAVAPPSLLCFDRRSPADDGGLDNSDDRLFDRRRHVAERCVSRVVELGSRKQPGRRASRGSTVRQVPRHSLSRAACAASIEPLFLPALALRGALLAASDDRVQADDRHDHP